MWSLAPRTRATTQGACSSTASPVATMRVMMPRLGERKYASREEAFWAHVAVGQGDECWEWRRGHLNGYGRLTTRAGRSDEVYAHREAWFLTHGAIPSDLWVLHHCDNRGCCNPCHLYLGDHVQNMADMAQRGRSRGPRGETHHWAKLTSADVRSIREWASMGGWKNSWLAEAFGVSPRLIRMILRNDIWKGQDAQVAH